MGKQEVTGTATEPQPAAVGGAHLAKKERWARAEYIALGALAVSVCSLLLTLGLTVGPSWIDSVWGPKAEILGLSNEDVVHSADIEVRVEIDNQGEMDHWLILKSGEEGKWYPQTRITTVGEGQFSPNYSVYLGSTGSFQMSVYETETDQGQSLREYLARPVEEKTGLLALPSGAKSLDVVTFWRE